MKCEMFLILQKDRFILSPLKNRYVNLKTFLLAGPSTGAEFSPVRLNSSFSTSTVKSGTMQRVKRSVLSPETFHLVACASSLEGCNGTRWRFGFLVCVFCVCGFVFFFLSPSPRRLLDPPSSLSFSGGAPTAVGSSALGPETPAAPAGAARGVRPAAAGCQCSPGVGSSRRSLLSAASPGFFSSPFPSFSPPSPPFPFKCRQSHYFWASRAQKGGWGM